MGTNVSTTVNDTVNKNVNKATVLAQQDIVQNNSDIADVNQVIKILIEGKLTCASLTLTNDAKVNLSSLSQASSDQKVAMASLVTQALASEAKNEMDQENKDLSLLQTNVATTINNAINETTTEQTSTMIQTFETVVEKTTNVSQTIEFRVTETAEVVVEGDCSFNNISSIEYTSQMVTNAAIDVVMQQETVQEAITSWDTAIKQSNKGMSLGAILGIIIGIIVLIIIIAVMAKFLPPYIAKKKAEKAAKGK